MNDTRSSWCLETLPDSPLTDLIRTGGEETGQVEGRTHGGNHLGKNRLGSQLLTLFLSGLITAHKSQALLEGSRDRDQRIPRRVLFDPFEHLGEVLVLLADVVLLAKINEVDDRLSRKKEKRVNGFDLLQVIELAHVAATLDNECDQMTSDTSIRRDFISYDLYVGIINEAIEELGLSSSALIHHSVVWGRME